MQNTRKGGLNAWASERFTPLQIVNRSFQNLGPDGNRPPVVLENIYSNAGRSWHTQYFSTEASVNKATRGVWIGVGSEKRLNLILPSFCLRAAHCGALPNQ